jgi:hypothetical protein
MWKPSGSLHVEGWCGRLAFNPVMGMFTQMKVRKKSDKSPKALGPIREPVPIGSLESIV